MNIAPVCINDYSGQISFESGKRDTAHKIIKEVSSEIKQKSKISKSAVKAWSAFKNHMSAWGREYVMLGGMLIIVAGALGLRINMDKREEAAREYIKSVDYDKYVDLCIKNAEKGLFDDVVNWTKVAREMKDSIAVEEELQRVKEEACKIEENKRRDSLRVYNYGFKDGLDQGRNEVSIKNNK